MLAMIAAVAIENVERVDTLEMMLPEPGGKDAGHPGVEARAEQRHQPRFLEAVLISPLPMIFALSLVARLVMRSAERRVGKEGVGTCRSRWVACIKKKKIK